MDHVPNKRYLYKLSDMEKHYPIVSCTTRNDIFHSDFVPH